MAAQSHILTLNSQDATDRMAVGLAGDLRAGDTLLLSGDVGAGKTHFARRVIQALIDVPEDIPSPTFTLVQTYASPRSEIWHTDLYRLTDVSEIEELGLIDAFAHAICLVEWPDRLGDLEPTDALSLSFEAGMNEDARIVTFGWSNPRWTPIVKRLTDDGS